SSQTGHARSGTGTAGTVTTGTGVGQHLRAGRHGIGRRRHDQGTERQGHFTPFSSHVLLLFFVINTPPCGGGCSHCLTAFYCVLPYCWYCLAAAMLEYRARASLFHRIQVRIGVIQAECVTQRHMVETCVVVIVL